MEQRHSWQGRGRGRGQSEGRGVELTLSQTSAERKRTSRARRALFGNTRETFFVQIVHQLVIQEKQKETLSIVSENRIIEQLGQFVDQDPMIIWQPVANLGQKIA